MTPFVLLIPLIAVVQFVFTLAMALLVSAGNVFFRDLGNVSVHVLRLWWYLSPGLYSLAFLDTLSIVDQYPIIKTLAEANPFAILFEAYRQVIYGSETGPPGFPDWGSLALLGVGSVVFLASPRSCSSASSRISRRSCDDPTTNGPPPDPRRRCEHADPGRRPRRPL